ncbi:MAG: SAM-dependent methyltransferase [Thermaurantiacus tibetensis]|uniref:SAM-dependent methyltransferase n=1 Tax=Thermaurantiacus tibetensis TaxID=2759035 RepID=UPI00188F8AA1|nr:SAM-dependent methyltransferase [Thermaurantiacus tibetensis]
MGQDEASRPFDSRLRRRARARGRATGGAGFLLAHAADELAAREALMPEGPPGPVLTWGAGPFTPPGHIAADLVPERLPATGLRLVCAEDQLPFGDATLARIRSVMGLHGVNDLPGALLLARRALLPGGRYLAVFPAGIALPQVRAAFLAADAAHGGVAARVGPTVDPAGAAGLLQRAGFAEPVAEVVEVRARYPGLAALARDARAMGETGWLAARSRVPVTRGAWAAAEAAFARGAEADGKVPVTLELLFLSARKPPGQP